MKELMEDNTGKYKFVTNDLEFVKQAIINYEN